MSDQGILFDAPAGRVRRSDPLSSVLAARTVDGSVPGQILEIIRAEPAHAFTADDLHARLPRVRQDTLRSAISQLLGRGVLIDAGMGESRCGRKMRTVRAA